MSGRGLGHTGGTIDKLEAIPGYRVELTTDEFVAQVREIGLAIIGQTANLVPADKLLYALRDVTATVDNVSLIAASIMSKKLAGGADAIVLDVKVGDGAFMKTIDDARALAEAMIELGSRAGRRGRLHADRHGPAARQAVGNALEIREAVDTIRGDGPADFTELVLASVAHLLALSDLGIDEFEGRRLAEEAVATGRRSRRTSAGSARRAATPIRRALPEAPIVREVTAPGSGVVQRARGDRVGLAALHLGAGRQAKDDTIDHAVGIVCRKKRGDAVEAGETARRGARRRRGVGGRGGAEVLAAYELGDEPPPARRIVLDRSASARASRGRDRARPAGAAPRRPADRRRADRRPRLTRPEDPAVVAARLGGERVEAVERRGKYLVVRFESGEVLLVHLRMTGGFRSHPASARAGGARTRRRNADRLPRRPAVRDVARCSSRRRSRHYLAVRLGAEPLERRFTTAFLAARLAGRRAPVKAAILDQRTVAGLGNIYADESLWYAGIHPLRPAGGAVGRRGRRGAPRGPPRAAARHPATGRDLGDYAYAGGVDAGRVPGLRAGRRAVRSLRHADREDARGRPGHLVLPALPGVA